MNITLSADDSLIEKAKAAARAQGTTLDDLLKRYVEELAGRLRPDEVADELIRLIAANPGSPDPDFKFDRETIQRRVLK